MNLRESLRKDAIERVIDTAQRMQQGTVHLVEGSRLICTLRMNIYNPDPDDSLYDVFIMVKQETHDLPVSMRPGTKYESILRSATVKLNEYATLMQPVILKACVDLVTRLASAVQVMR